jgi:hypothetical protein
MLALTELSELSMLDDELERLKDDVLRAERVASRLDDELLRLRLEA